MRRERLDHAPTEIALEVAVHVEPERFEPGEPRLLSRTPEQLEEIGQGGNSSLRRAASLG